MRFRDADRAQAIQVGAILLFGILIVGLSLYQATVVPQQNERVEFDAYQQATTDMVSVRDDIVTAGTEGASASTTVTTGATYPQRALFVNPGPPSGTVSTESAPNVTLSGVRAIESETENTQEFWNATSGTYETRRVTFDPAYNELEASPVTVASQGVYRLPGSRVLPISRGSSIRSNRITLVTVRGDMSASGRAVPVTADPVTTATRTVVITGTGPTFNVTVPTPGNATAWNETVGPSLVANPNVETTTPLANGSARITFVGDRQYELRLAAVELRGQSDASVVESPRGAYLTPVTQNETVYLNRSNTVAVEVRNRYNNPVSGESVTFNVTDSTGTFSDGTTKRTVATDGEGRARVNFRPNTTGSTTVEATADLDGDGSIASYERSTFDLVSLDPENLGPAEQGDVILEYGETPQSPDQDDVTVSFNNTASENRTITEARISFYYPSGQDANPPSSITLGGTDLPVPGQLTELASPQTLSPGPGQTISLTVNGGSGVPVSGDFIVLTVRFEETGTLSTYFVTLEKA